MRLFQNTLSGCCNFVQISGDNMLDILYTNIDCNTVQKVSLGKDHDLICDEDGLYKQYDFAWKIDLSEDGSTVGPIVGKCAIVKNKVDRWEPFIDETEAIEFMFGNIDKIHQIRVKESDNGE